MNLYNDFHFLNSITEAFPRLSGDILIFRDASV